MTTASLARITVYPIKSLDGVELDAVDVLPTGALAHDRRFALVDEEGRLVNGKRTPAVNRIRAEYDLSAMHVRLRVGDETASARLTLDDERDRLAACLSELIGIDCQLIENTEQGFPDDIDAPGPTVISTATLREVAGWYGLSLEESRRRFRANLEIDGVEPFWEDRLVGPAGSSVPFTIGPVHWLGMKACQRCVVPTRSSLAGDVTPSFQKTFAAERQRTLPAWATRERFDHFYRLAVNTQLAPGESPATLHVGDTVQVGQ